MGAGRPAPAGRVPRHTPRGDRAGHGRQQVGRDAYAGIYGAAARAAVVAGASSTTTAPSTATTSAPASDDPTPSPPTSSALLPGQPADVRQRHQLHQRHQRHHDRHGRRARGWNPPLGVSDFVFDVSDTAAPGGWAAAPRPFYSLPRAGTGVGGSDRTSFVWADGAIRNQWLRVTVPPPPGPDCAAPDVFYFGNLVGESGDVEGLRVNSLDLAATKRALNTNRP